MTLTVQNPSIEYQGDGIQTTFTFQFRLFAEVDLKVFVDTVQQVLFSDYVINNLTEAGGEVEFNVPPADLTKVLLIRATPKAQQTDLEPFSPFPADTIEYTFDYAIAITQELEQRFIDNVQPQVFSFNGRVGDIVPDITDYSQFYADLDDYNSHKANENAHHAKLHAHNGADGSGVVDHASTDNRGAESCHPITAITDFRDVGATPYEVGTGIVWTGTKWESLNVWVAGAYGGIVQDTPVGLPDLGVPWVTLLADTPMVTTPRGIIQDFAQNGLIFNFTGVYSVAVSFTITHIEAQAGREIEIRLYNATKAVGTEGTIIGIGRNQSATNFATTILAEIPQSEVGDLWQAQIGNGDAVLGVEERSFNFMATQVSEYRG